MSNSTPAELKGDAENALEELQIAILKAADLLARDFPKETLRDVSKTNVGEAYAGMIKAASCLPRIAHHLVTAEKVEKLVETAKKVVDCHEAAGRGEVAEFYNKGGHTKYWLSLEKSVAFLSAALAGDEWGQTMTPPKWLKIAIPLNRLISPSSGLREADLRRVRRYASQGRGVAPGGGDGAWQPYPGAGWVCHPKAAVDYPDLGRPYGKSKILKGAKK